MASGVGQSGDGEAGSPTHRSRCLAFTLDDVRQRRLRQERLSAGLANARSRELLALLVVGQFEMGVGQRPGGTVGEMYGPIAEKDLSGPPGPRTQHMPSRLPMSVRQRAERSAKDSRPAPVRA
jgi:hypothetical protein